MKFLKILLLTAALMGLSQTTLAHEGHDHDAPGMVKAPKGGMIKSLDNIHVEVVSKGQNVQIHYYNKELKPVDVSGYPTTAEIELPRTKKKESITLNKVGQNFEYTYDAKNAHRYTLSLAVTDPSIKETVKLTFTIEPRKGK